MILPLRLRSKNDYRKEGINLLQFNNLEELIGEATEYDKKQAVELKKPKSWCKSVSAFANTSGGILIFGIADDNSVVGLSDAEHDAEAVSEIMKNRLSPVPEFNLGLHFFLGDGFFARGIDRNLIRVKK
ncbi:AlbA family DNA-binding domain-containing protein [Hornefia butyriciproducens]|uniref:AlbA family DNA-binding domain-containing protein n=1 Tax=Hornefia butyriciproducens TaxID=2652293 RepID=UPI003F8913A5